MVVEDANGQQYREAFLDRMNIRLMSIQTTVHAQSTRTPPNAARGTSSCPIPRLSLLHFWNNHFVPCQPRNHSSIRAVHLRILLQPLSTSFICLAYSFWVSFSSSV